MIEDRPALGAVMKRLDVRPRRQNAIVEMYRSRDEHTARQRFVERLDKILLGALAHRRWDLLAADLRDLANAAERVPQRLLDLELARTAGGPCGPPAEEQQAA